jgi:predicted ferric reductase
MTVDRQRPRPDPAAWVGSLLWPALAAAVGIPIAVAANSPQLAWRDPVYVAAGFAGVIAMALLLVQPLLVRGYLTGLSGRRGRRMHRRVGGVLFAAVVLHVAGLWVTSPPDVVDALLFRSPTPFSVWGVIALWAVFAAALLGAFRQRLHLGAHLWRFAHSVLAMVVVVGSVIHAMQIEGTMGAVSKAMLCALALAATVWVIFDLRSWARLSR